MRSIVDSVSRKTQQVVVKSIVIAKIRRKLSDLFQHDSKDITFEIKADGSLILNPKNQYLAQELRLRENDFKELSPCIKKVKVKLN